MRLREITESKQLDEAFPIIGAIGATVIPGLGGLTIRALGGAVLTAFTALDLYQYALKFKDDPTSMEWYDWSWVVFDAYCMKGPLKSLSQQARKKIFDAIPDSAKKALGEAVKAKVLKDVGKDAAKTADNVAAGADDIYKPQPRRNRVDSVPSAKTAEPVTPAATTAPQKTAPKNPNLIDRPFKKEELMRLAGLAK
jgi:hypothetical protein